jgi:hypothetical protein
VGQVHVALDGSVASLFAMTLSFCHPCEGRGSAFNRVSPFVARCVEANMNVAARNHKLQIFSTIYHLSFRRFNFGMLAPNSINIFLLIMIIII